MKTVHYNGEYWYTDLRPFIVRLFRWFVWIGGWETTVWTPKGVTSGTHIRRSIRLAYRARGHRSVLWSFFHSACPLSFFGHKITFQSFGFHISTRYGYFCVSWPDGIYTYWRAYWSPNATPSSATFWLVGAPRDVVRAARQQQDHMTAERIAQEEREASLTIPTERVNGSTHGR